MNAKEIIDRLIEAGFTKWEIKNRLGVSWTSLNHWHMERFNPSKKNLKELKKLDQDHNYTKPKKENANGEEKTLSEN